MTDFSERPALAPTLSHWESRLSRTAVALTAITFIGWAGDVWRLVENGFGKSDFVLLAKQLSVFLVLFAVVLALLPEIISGVTRARDRSLNFVFASAAALGVVAALVNLASAVLEFGDRFSPYQPNALDHLSGIAFPLVVAALGFLGLSDSRFVPGLGGFRPPPPRPDVTDLPA